MAEVNSSGGNSAVDEILFLRQTVHRLNAALSKYQGVDSLGEFATTGICTTPPPWLSNPVMLSPLVNEYEKHLSTLISQLTSLTRENKDSTAKLEILNDENQRLHQELHDIVQQHLEDVENSELGKPQDDAILKNLQTQLELAYREKDAALEMNKETVKILDKLRHEKVTEVSHSRSRERIFDETKARNEKLEDMNLQMQMTIEMLQKENQAFAVATTQQLNDIKSLRDQLKSNKQTIRQSTQHEDELKQLADNLKAQVSDLETKNDKLVHKDMLNSTKNRQLESSLAETEGRLAQALQNTTNAHSQIDHLKIRITALENTNAEIEEKEMTYLMQIRESAQLLDDALLARDAAVVREKQREQDVANASAAMETLVEEVADRIKREVDRVQSQANNKLQRMLEELETLELEAANLRSDADRAKRAKRTAETELDAVVRQRNEDSDRARIEDFQRRTINAERARDDALITVQSLEDRIKRLNMEGEDDKMRLVSTNQTLEQRVKRLQRQVDESQHERVHLLESCNQYKHDIQKLEEEARTAKLNAVKEFAISKDRLEREKKQLECRLKGVDDASRRSTAQLNTMLADQQRINARWKEETKTAVERYEDKIKDLQSQLSSNRRKCQDLTNKLQCWDAPARTMAENVPPMQANTTTRQQSKVDTRVPELEESNRQLRARLHATEYKLLNATQRMGEMQGLHNSLTMHDL